jgi:hypothetical protein
MARRGLDLKNYFQVSWTGEDRLGTERTTPSRPFCLPSSPPNFHLYFLWAMKASLKLVLFLSLVQALEREKTLGSPV